MNLFIKFIKKRKIDSFLIFYEIIMIYIIDKILD